MSCPLRQAPQAPAREILANSAALAAMILLLQPTTSAAQIVEEWATDQGSWELPAGQLDLDPALEIVRQAGNGDVEILDGASGQVQAIIQRQSFGSLSGLIRDLDGDGDGELLLLWSAGGGTSDALGAYDITGALPATELWFRSASGIGIFDVADMDGAMGSYLVIGEGATRLLVLDGVTGTIAFDSSVSGSWPPSSYAAIEIVDVDGDGFEDVLGIAAPLAPGIDRRFLLRTDDKASPAPVGDDGSIGAVLYPSYPNPSPQRSMLSFALAQAGPVELRIFDAAGRHVRTLLRREMTAGRHRVEWDGRDQSGMAVASGVYHSELRTPDGRRSRKLVQLR